MLVIMGARYRTQAINSDGGDGRAHVPGGLDVAVASPLGTNVEAGTNPEQLLALAWSTCLNATAQVIVAGDRRTSVRVEVELHQSEPGPGYEFHVDAYLSAEGATHAQAEEILTAAHARCPVSKLLSGSATVHTHVEDFTGQ